MEIIRLKNNMFEWGIAKKRLLIRNHKEKNIENNKEQIDKKNQEVRILLYGDSVTNADYLDERYSFYRLLENMINYDKKNSDGKTAKIIKKGIDGVTSYYGVQLIRQELSRYKPDIIFINFFLNDMDALAVINEKIITKLTKNDEEKVLRNMINKIITTLPKTRIVFWGPTLVTKGYLAHYDEKTEEEILNVQKDFVTMLRTIMKRFKEEGIDYIDINDSLDETCIMRDGIHPNKKGHKIIAKQIYDYFIKHLMQIIQSKQLNDC